MGHPRPDKKESSGYAGGSPAIKRDKGRFSFKEDSPCPLTEGELLFYAGEDAHAPTKRNPGYAGGSPAIKRQKRSFLGTQAARLR